MEFVWSELSSVLFVFLAAVVTGAAFSFRAYRMALDLIHKLERDNEDLAKKLSASQAKLHRAFEGTGDGAWEWNIETRRLEISQRVAEILGYGAEEVSSGSLGWVELIHPLDLPPVREKLLEYLNGAAPRFEVEYRVKSKTGEWKWILCRGQVTERAGDGRPLLMVGSHTDVSALKRAESELLTYKSALEQSDVIAFTDSQGRITDVNEMFCKISGYAREELIGKDHRVLSSGTMPEGFFKDMWREISQGRTWHGDICNRSKDGTLYWLSTTIVPFLDVHGKPQSYIAIRRNITSHKQIEEALRSSNQHLLERLESSPSEPPVEQGKEPGSARTRLSA